MLIEYLTEGILLCMTDQASEQNTGPHHLATPKEKVVKKSVSPLYSAFTFVGECCSLFGESMVAFFQGKVSFSDLLNQMAAVGADSVGIVVLISIATGAVFSFYITTISLVVGFTGFVGSGVTYAFLNELGPVLGGVAYASRVASSIAAEIGSMVVTEQVEALRSMAISPVRYLVAPRVIACAVTMPLLVVVADFVGVSAGYFFSGFGGVAHGDYLNSIYSFIKPGDLTTGLLKSVWFGIVVGVVSCRQGLKTSRGATGVGKATTSSVVICVVLIFVSDLALTHIITGAHSN